MKEFQFSNVTIVIAAPDAEQAYNLLCSLLSKSEKVEYETDTYRQVADDDGHAIEAENRATCELWPE